MRKFSSFIAVFAALVAQTAFAAGTKSLPTLSTGDFFVVTEEMRIESDEFLGQGSFLLLSTDPVYEVMGTMEVTQEKSTTPGPYNCYHLRGEGELNMTGNVNITNPLPISGPARIQNGTYEADTYIEVATFKTVKKKRVFSGTAEYQLPSGVWFAIGDLVIEENEEYEPLIPEMPFPLSASTAGTATINILAFGSINAAGLLTTTFDVPLTINPTYATVEEDIEVNGTTYESYKVTHTDDAQGVSLSNNYVCEASNSVKYEITNLPLGDTGQIKYLRATVNEFDVAESSCDAVVGGTTYQLTSPKTNYAANEAVKWDLVFTNTGSAAYAGTAYVILDVGGVLYWFNLTTKAIAEVGVGIEQASVSCNAGGSNTYNLLEFTSFPSLGVGAPGFPLSWYAAALDSSTGSFGAVVNITTYHP